MLILLFFGVLFFYGYKISEACDKTPTGWVCDRVELLEIQDKSFNTINFVNKKISKCEAANGFMRECECNMYCDFYSDDEGKVCSDSSDCGSGACAIPKENFNTESYTQDPNNKAYYMCEDECRGKCMPYPSREGFSDYYYLYDGKIFFFMLADDCKCDALSNSI